MPRLKGRGPRRSHPAFPPEHASDTPDSSQASPTGPRKKEKRGRKKRSAAVVPGATSPRITTDPAIFSGKPILRGRRLAVEHVLGLLAVGETIETVLVAYPFLDRADVLACLAFAFETVRDKHEPEGFVLL